MAELNDWQWAIGAAVLMASLVIGGWLSRERLEGSEDNDPPQDKEPITTGTVTPSNDASELGQLRQQLETATAS